MKLSAPMETSCRSRPTLRLPRRIAAQDRSVVARLDQHTWNDADWISQRARKIRSNRHRRLRSPSRLLAPRSEKRSLAEPTANWATSHPVCKGPRLPHIELLPIMEHPTTAPGVSNARLLCRTSRFGTPAEFMEFVDRCHQAGIGVILDWTPAHFPRDTHGSRIRRHAPLRTCRPAPGRSSDWGTLV